MLLKCLLANVLETTPSWLDNLNCTNAHESHTACCIHRLLVQELGGAALKQGFLAIWATFWRLPLIYLAIFVVRGLSIAALAPLLRFSGIHLTRGGQILSTLAALRGGISLILAQTLVLGFNKVQADRVVVSQVRPDLLPAMPLLSPATMRLIAQDFSYSREVKRYSPCQKTCSCILRADSSRFDFGQDVSITIVGRSALELQSGLPMRPTISVHACRRPVSHLGGWTTELSCR